MAHAVDPAIPDSSVERLARVLDALDVAFRPLAQSLTADCDPAPVFRPSSPSLETNE
jgi:hypothetical protein